MRIISAKDYQQMSRHSANVVSAQVILKPDSVIGLATGSTPMGMYTQLIKWYQKGDLDFSNVVTFNLDEYVGLGKEDEHSYYNFMLKNFFDHINIKKENVHIPSGIADDIDLECSEYERKIKSYGIDFQVLGIGHNGHIGFNEPYTHFGRDTRKVELAELTILANSRFFENPNDVPTHAISMGMRTIMQAKKILLLASGKHKASVLKQALYGKIDPIVPASILQLHTDITVVADMDALSEI